MVWVRDALANDGCCGLSDHPDASETVASILENRSPRAQAGLILFPFGAMVNLVVPASAPPKALVTPLRTVI
jgi:hypothetical protein